MQPSSQSVLLESFPPRKRGVAMAVFGLGVVVAPIIGPTLGGWLTDSYSWRWVFYINVPADAVALVLIEMFLEDPPYIRNARASRIDYVGFVLLAVWVGSLHLMLAKGQQAEVLMGAQLSRQASLWAFVDNFRLLAFLALACIPAVFLLRRPKHTDHPARGAAGAGPAAAPD